MSSKGYRALIDWDRFFIASRIQAPPTAFHDIEKKLCV